MQLIHQKWFGQKQSSTQIFQPMIERQIASSHWKYLRSGSSRHFDFRCAFSWLHETRAGRMCTGELDGPRSDLLLVGPFLLDSGSDGGLVGTENEQAIFDGVQNHVAWKQNGKIGYPSPGGNRQLHAYCCKRYFNVLSRLWGYSTGIG